MMMAIFKEHMRCYRIDRARYHAAMDEYWARKRREKLLGMIAPRLGRSARWAQKKKRPSCGNS